MYPCSLWNPLKLKKNFILISMHLTLLFVYTCSWFVYMALYSFMYNECIYVSLLTVYWEAFMPIVLWNKL